MKGMVKRMEVRGESLYNWRVRQASLRPHIVRHKCEVREWATWIFQGRAFAAEGTAHVKDVNAQMWEKAHPGNAGGLRRGGGGARRGMRRNTFLYEWYAENIFLLVCQTNRKRHWVIDLRNWGRILQSQWTFRIIIPWTLWIFTFFLKVGERSHISECSTVRENGGVRNLLSSALHKRT